MADEKIEQLLQELIDLQKSKPTGGAPKTSGRDFGGSSIGGTDFKKAGDFFVNALNEGGGSVSNFAKGMGKVLPNIPLLDKVGAGAINVVEYVENLQGVFNSLSKVGAGGAADLGELQLLAGQANLSLDAFANIVGNNAKTFTALGGSVDAGKRRFSELNSALYDTGMIEQFKMLGYTSQEASEFMAENLQMTMRSARLSGMTDEQAVEHTANLAKNMQVLAKLSGKDVQQMRDESIARQRDGATNGALRLMEMKGAKNATKNFQNIVSMTGDLPKAAQDLIKDVVQLNNPLTKATSGFAAINGEALNIAKDLRKAIQADDAAEVERLTKEYSAAVKGQAGSMQGAYIASLGQVSDIGQTMADVFQDLKPQIDALDGILDVQAGQFKTAGELATAYLENLKKIEAATKAQIEGEDKGQAAINFLNDGQIVLSKSVGALNQDIGLQISSNETVVDAFKSGSDLINAIPKEFSERLGGLLSFLPGMDDKEILSFLESNVGKTIETSTGEMVTVTQSMVDEFKKYSDPSTSAADQADAFQSLKNGGLFDESGNLKVSVMKIAENARGGSTSTLETEKEAEGLISKILGSLNPFNEGTLGSTGSLFKDFGSGSAALLHGLEAVVPKDSPQGQLLSAFPNGLGDVSNNLAEQIAEQGQLLSAFPNGLGDVSNNLANIGAKFDPAMMSQTQKELMSQVNAPPSVSRTGETSENSLDNLNQTMLQLVEINRKALSIANKQLSATKGLDGNVMSSVGL